MIENVNDVSRMAHDMRSPIAVMEMTLQTLSQHIPQDEANILRYALQNIREMANHLLLRYRKSYPELMSQNPEYQNTTCYLLLSSLMTKVIACKRKEWIKNICELTFEVEDNARWLWIYAAPNEIQNLLSNLLNNAYESLRNNNKQIHIKLTYYQDQIILHIHDTGIGISKNNIQKVLTGLSLKHPGKGLGLSQAKSYLESIDGKLQLISTENVGTTVSLFFPVTNCPAWFPNAITLPRGGAVVILDEDPEIHNTWRELLQEKNISVQHFTQTTQLYQWQQYHAQSYAEIIYLISYELREENKNGFDVLQQLHANKNGYLMIDYFEDATLQNKVAETGIWLLPKSFLRHASVLLAGIQRVGDQFTCKDY